MDLGTLPAPARYAIALAVVAAVVVIVVITRPSGAQPSRWYDVVVTVGAIVLLLVGLALLVRLIVSPGPPGRPSMSDPLQSVACGRRCTQAAGANIPGFAA